MENSLALFGAVALTTGAAVDVLRWRGARHNSDASLLALLATSPVNRSAATG